MFVGKNEGFLSGTCGHRTFEPESVEEVAIRGDDDGGIFVREDFNQFWSLGKVFVSRVFGSEE